MQVKIKCTNENHLTCIYTVSIYNNKNELICQKKTKSNGNLDIHLPYGIYTIIATSRWETICKTVLVNAHLCNLIPFLFKNHITSPVTLILTDSHYENMPIEEGVITLWPNI